MFQLATHFEQVSLQSVRKIVEDQLRRKAAAEQEQGARQKTLEEVLLETQNPPHRTDSHTFTGGTIDAIYESKE